MLRTDPAYTKDENYQQSYEWLAESQPYEKSDLVLLGAIVDRLADIADSLQLLAGIEDHLRHMRYEK